MDFPVIEFTSSPSLADVGRLAEGINESAVQHGISTTAGNPFGFFIRNSEGKTVAGCNGYFVFGSLYVDQLWVDPNNQKQGYGKALMEKVHEFGREEGCSMVCLTTMSFQAEPFYRKLGYEVDFKRDGYTGGSQMIFLRKML